MNDSSYKDKWQTKEEKRQLERMQNRIQDIYKVLVAMPSLEREDDEDIVALAADVVDIIDRKAKKRLDLRCSKRTIADVKSDWMR